MRVSREWSIVTSEEARWHARRHDSPFTTHHSPEENTNGRHRAGSWNVAHADAARIGRDAAAFSRDRREDEASRQGGPPGDVWRAPGEGRSRACPPGGTGEPGGASEQGARRGASPARR